MRRTVDSVSRGLFLILLGLVFFLNTYGILPWHFWVNFIDLWPLLFIFGGIALFFNKRIPFSAVLVVFLMTLVGYSFVQGVPQFDQRTPLREASSSAMELAAPLENGVKNSDIELNLGGVQVNVLGSPGGLKQNTLLTGTYQWNNRVKFGDAPKFTQKQSGDTARIQFDSESKPSSGNSQLDLQLSDQVDYNFDIDAGAVNGIFDFSLLRVNTLDMDTGASDMELRFGDTGVHTKAELSAGASKVKLVVPENVGLKINISGITSDTNFTGDGLFFEDKEWVSSNYNEAKTTIEMNISMAAGKVDLERTAAVAAQVTH